MKIVVCIKQVPDSTTVRMDPKRGTLIREGVVSIINPFDLYAVEEALRIREKFGGTVTVLSMGPSQAESAMKETISLGVDEAILITDRAFAGSDTWATSYTLSQAIRKIGEVDLILCGKQAVDGDTAQVGPGIATHLDIPQITFVRKIESLQPDKKLIRAERMTEEGYDVVESPLPCLLTVVKEINEPRYASLKGKMRASKYTVPVWTNKELECNPDWIGLAGSPTRVMKIFAPPPRTQGKILDGDLNNACEQLVEALKDRLQ